MGRDTKRKGGVYHFKVDSQEGDLSASLNAQILATSGKKGLASAGGRGLRSLAAETDGVRSNIGRGKQCGLLPYEERQRRVLSLVGPGDCGRYQRDIGVGEIGEKTGQNVGLKGFGGVGKGLRYGQGLLWVTGDESHGIQSGRGAGLGFGILCIHRGR